jgi:hypothetical protein
MCTKWDITLLVFYTLNARKPNSLSGELGLVICNCKDLLRIYRITPLGGSSKYPDSSNLHI